MSVGIEGVRGTEHYTSFSEITRPHSFISGKLEYINGNQTFIWDSHRPFICTCSAIKAVSQANKNYGNILPRKKLFHKNSVSGISQMFFATREHFFKLNYFAYPRDKRKLQIFKEIIIFETVTYSVIASLDRYTVGAQSIARLCQNLVN
jgi:hypothetical protein